MQRLARIGCLVGAVCVTAALAPRAANTFVSFPSAHPRTAQQIDSSVRGGPADIVLVNGQIYTMDPAHPWATAVAIRGDSIVALAYADAPSNSTAPPVTQTRSSDELKALRGRSTRVIDLHGQFAMPGFNDAHIHMAEAAYARTQITLVGTTSLADFEQRIRVNISFYRPGEWIVGYGWDHTVWPRKVFPTREDLDAVSTTNPIFCTRIDGHVAVANSRALEIAGVTAKTPDPPGGHIERDPKTGEPTGLLEETAAMQLVASHIPPHSLGQRATLFGQVLEEAARYGVTSIQDNSVMALPDNDDFGWQNFLVLQQMKREGKLPIRITEWLPFDASLANLQDMRTAAGTADPFLKSGALKLHLDGSLGSRTAAMLAPYSDAPKTSGILRVDPATLGPMAIERDKAGFQIAFHAIGDRANRLALDTFAAVIAANGDRDRRDRVEHAQVVAPADFDRFGKLQIVASMQPAHLLDDARWASARLGPIRSKGAYAWLTMQKSGGKLAFGTDYPDFESVNPLQGIYACVTRQMLDGTPAGGWEPQERLPIDDCLRAYTVGSAYAEFEEPLKGTLAPGMYADIVVYPANLLQIPAPELLKTPVSMTFVAGRLRYSATASAAPTH